MSRWVAAMDAHFDGLYDQVPDVGCRGLCQDSCGPIDMHPYERARIRRTGVEIPTPETAVRQLVETGDYQCPALVDGRCSVYRLRPLICRIWGAAEDLPCEYGCRPPSGGLLPGAVAHALVEASASPVPAPAVDRRPGTPRH